MTAVIITDCAPWDGRYEFDDFSFTNRELYEIKQLSGIRAGELIEALETNDTAAYVGVALVVLQRHGVKLDPDDLWNAKVGSISIDLGADADAENPQTPPPADEPENDTTGSGGDSTSDGA